jgi:hypothetical protein
MVFNSSHRSRRTSPSTLFALCRSCVEGRWARRHSTPQERAYLLEVITPRWAAGRSADRMLRVPPTTGPRPAAHPAQSSEDQRSTSRRPRRQVRVDVAHQLDQHRRAG